MHYQSGTMRDLHLQSSPIKNIYDQNPRSKYQKSEISYGKSKVYYEEDKSDRFNKNSQTREVTKKIPIKLKSTERQEYWSWLRIELYNINEKGNNCIAMHITDDQNSMFLWSFYVRESEFLNLKSQHRMKVDFHGFPEMIMEWLDLCEDLGKEGLIDKQKCYYSVFDIKKGNQEAELKILEANKFKESEHLALKFKRPNDNQGKQYIAGKYDKQRLQTQKLRQQLALIQDQLNRRSEQALKNNYLYEQLQRESTQKLQQLQRKDKQKIQSITFKIEEQFINKQREEKEKNDKKIEELNEKIEELKNKYDELYRNYQKGNERIIHLESSQGSLKSKNSILEQQNENYEKINRDLKSKEMKLNEQFHNLKNQNTKLSCTVQSLEDKIKERDQRLTENGEYKSSSNSQIMILEESLRQQKKKCEKLEEKNESLEGELGKMKKKCEELSHKYQKKKEKINDYKEILYGQQQKIQENQKEVRRLIDQANQLKREKQKIEIDLRDRDIKIKDLKNNLEDSEQNRQNLKKMLSNFNKQMNQRHFVVPSYSPIGNAPSSQSRIKFSQINSTISVNTNEQSQRIVPPIKKYREGIENDRDRQNSKSPAIKRLSQQQDPQQMQKTREKIGPIKFRK